MQIREIEVEGMRSLNGTFPLRGKTVARGRVGAGKTSLIDAIAFGALGYVPRFGKRGLAQIIRGDRLAVRTTLEDGRTWTRVVARLKNETRSDAEASWAAHDEAHQAILSLFGVGEEDVREATDARTLLLAEPADRTLRVEALLAAAAPDSKMLIARAGALTVLRLCGGEKMALPVDVEGLRDLARSSAAGLSPAQQAAARTAWEGVVPILKTRGPVEAFDTAKRQKLAARARREAMEAKAGDAPPTAPSAEEVAALRTRRDDLAQRANAGKEITATREQAEAARKRLADARVAHEAALKALDDLAGPLGQARGAAAELAAVPRAEAQPDMAGPHAAWSRALAELEAAEASPLVALAEGPLLVLNGAVGALADAFGGDRVRAVVEADALVVAWVRERTAGVDLKALRAAEAQAKKASEDAVAAYAAWRDRDQARAQAQRDRDAVTARLERIENEHRLRAGLVEGTKNEVATAEELLTMRAGRIGDGSAAVKAEEARAALPAAEADLQRAELAVARAAAVAEAVRDLEQARAQEAAFAALEWACGRVRDEAVADRSGPVVNAMAQVLASASRHELPYLRAGGKSGPEFGWRLAGEDRPLAALSGGETALFMAAFAIALARVRGPEVPILLLEAEGVVGDDEVVAALLAGLGAAEDVQVVLAGRIPSLPAPWQALDIGAPRAAEKALA